jgi:hypothetical protein
MISFGMTLETIVSQKPFQILINTVGRDMFGAACAITSRIVLDYGA